MSTHTKICDDVNEDGRPISVHICGDCGNLFTLCPPYDESWGGCLGGTCSSYDESRDLDKLFDDEPWRNSQ